MHGIFPSLWLGLGLFLMAQLYNQASAKEVVSRRCHQCGGDPDGESPVTPCSSPDGSVKATLCPPEQPYCATVASSPNFTSLVTCAAEVGRPCSLIYSDKRFTMTCVCTTHLCNAPFSAKLRQELIEFSRTNVSTVKSGTDFIETLWNISHYGNSVDDSGSFYKLITVPIKETIFFPKTTTSDTVSHGAPFTKEISLQPTPGEVPLAEALKNEASVLSSDDEDELEGSGSYEDNSPTQSASAPAAPSSLLPADENNAATLALDLVALASLLLYGIQ